MTVHKKFRKFARMLARYGCVSIGTVYILLGSMAILSLFGRAEDDADEERAMDYLLEYTLGEVFVWVILAGMVGYIVWRIFEAVTDPYDFGNDLKGIGKRVGIALTSVGYGLIAYSAFDVLQGNGEDSEQEMQSMIAQVLEWQGGSWLVGTVGLMTGIAGLFQFRFVISGAYKHWLSIDELSKLRRRIIYGLAWAGYLARGVILLVLSYFLLRAAFKENPEEVGDTDTAFDFIGGGLIGDSAFFLVALGTIAYGLFMYVFSVCYKFEKD
jgi:hypothetical protein